jgi:poly(beta-D-mannuronate) lyase
VKKLVKISTDGLVDPSLFEKRTGIPQERPDPPSAEAIGWTEPYNRRFLDATITRLLRGPKPQLHLACRPSSWVPGG